MVSHRDLCLCYCWW